MRDEYECRIRSYNKAELEKLHTKQLLRYYRYCYSQFDWIERNGNCCAECCGHGKECWATLKANHDLVCSILNTREHVPNKKESKANRINKKKSGKSDHKSCRKGLRR